MLLWGDTARRVKVIRVRKDAAKLVKLAKVDGGFDLWNKACGNFFKVAILYIFGPIFLFLIVGELFFGRMEIGYSASEVINLTVLIIAYLGGVMATYKHAEWREKNISHLVGKPDVYEVDDSELFKPPYSTKERSSAYYETMIVISEDIIKEIKRKTVIQRSTHLRANLGIDLQTSKENTLLSQTVLFYDCGLDIIFSEDVDSAVYFDYYSITKFVETQNTYILFAKNKHIIVVNKTILVEEQKSEWFLRFLREKCKDVK